MRADFVLGCDGAFSNVRKAYMRKAGFNYKQEYIPHLYLELCIPATEKGEVQFVTGFALLCRLVTAVIFNVLFVPPCTYLFSEGIFEGILWRYLPIALPKKFPVSLSVCESVCLLICPSRPKRLEIDPTYGISLDHNFHEECHGHNFLSVCLAGWLVGCLQKFCFYKFFSFFRLKFWARRKGVQPDNAVKYNCWRP